MGELDSREEIVFVCKIGKRSAKAAELVRGAGFDRARSLEGGLIAWSREIDPSMPVY
jgi:adenylyltransferase/sulfurtransferase